jgi:tetratricopeptide (TPR) repeat protein
VIVPLGALLSLLLAWPAHAYEEEPDLPRGELLLLEGRSEEAVAWYRTRLEEEPTPEWREGLAEALAALGADLLELRRPADARRALEEAERLTRDPGRLERIRHLTAYAEQRTTGQGVGRAHGALANGDLGGALAHYERALLDARDAFERRQSATLLAFALLLQGSLSSEPAPLAERAAQVWPLGEPSGEDAEIFLHVARAHPLLGRRLGDALAQIAPAKAGEESAAVRVVALCVLRRTREAEAALGELSRPEWREALQTLLSRAERMAKASE